MKIDSDVLSQLVRDEIFNKQITIAMAITNGSASAAASILGISDRQMYRKIAARKKD